MPSVPTCKGGRPRGGAGAYYCSKHSSWYYAASWKYTAVFCRMQMFFYNAAAVFERYVRHLWTPPTAGSWYHHESRLIIISNRGPDPDRGFILVGVYRECVHAHLGELRRKHLVVVDRPPILHKTHTQCLNVIARVRGYRCECPERDASGTPRRWINFNWLIIPW